MGEGAVTAELSDEHHPAAVDGVKKPRAEIPANTGDPGSQKREEREQFSQPRNFLR
jgi:hypothetical protein